MFVYYVFTPKPVNQSDPIHEVWYEEHWLLFMSEKHTKGTQYPKAHGFEVAGIG